MTSELSALLGRTAAIAMAYLHSVRQRPVGPPTPPEILRPSLGGPLPEGPSDPADVIEALARGVEPGLVTTNGGRYFGFVEGGVLPAALAAEWLTSTWDQNPAMYVLSPAAAVVEEICAGWLLDVLGLPATASVGLTTGAQMANVVGLAAARHRVLAARGWDVEADGLNGAPRVTVLVGAQRHATIGRALRFLGFGERTPVIVPADEQGRMVGTALTEALSGVDGPAIVCAQAGNVNTGAFDPLREVCEAAGERGAWVHVDGAFGLWAAASPRLAHLADGAELADSWATDGHKWLNVPYDCGIVACAHPDSHRAAMALRAAYLVRNDNEGRSGSDWSPESSRRARAFAVWAALRSLGRSGVADLVERGSEQAQRFATVLGDHPAVQILNDVVLNQVLVRIGNDDDWTRRTIAAVQHEGATWMGGTDWNGETAMRISVSDHATSTREVDQAAEAVLRAVALTATAPVPDARKAPPGE
jgi:glutamate/tyrosine decarboxylase-like PLP-dependent enzyme